MKSKIRRDMAKKAHRAGTCVYCGELAKTLTTDHVPPRLLFEPLQRNQLIRVPSCRACNNGASKDDEYFRAMLAMNENSRRSGSLDEARIRLVRSLQHPEARDFATAIDSSLQSVEATTPSGLHLGDRTIYRFHDSRIKRVINRIARGIFWHETGTALPAQVDVKSGLAWGFPDIAQPMRDMVAQSLGAVVSQLQLKPLVKDAFKYAIVFPEDRRPWRSAILMEFYRGIGFVVTTAPPSPDAITGQDASRFRGAGPQALDA